MKVAFYGRYSTDMQRETSIEDQLRNCERYAQREGWKVAIQYADRAESGQVKDRSDFQRMLADANKKMFDVLLVDNVGRLTRGIEGPLPTIHRLRFHGIRVIGVTDGVDSAQKNWKLTAGFHGMKNNMFLDDHAENVTRGMTGQAIKGFSCGGRPYGYKPVPIYSKTKKNPYGQPAVEAVKRVKDPEQEKWVKKIFHWYGVDRWSPRRIADELNRLKVPSPGSTWKRETRRCNGWVNSSITSILQNPLYIGIYIWNKSRWERDPDTSIYKHRPRPESEWIETRVPELAIVDKKVWDAVQARRAALREKNKQIQAERGPRARYSAPFKYLFSGLLVCGVCGANYIIKQPNQYACGGNHAGGKHNCSNSLHVSRELVETKLLAAIKNDLFGDEAMERMKRRIVQMQAERKRMRKPDLEAAQRELARVEKEIENLVVAIKAGAFSPALKAELTRLETDRERLQATLKVDPRPAAKVVQIVPQLVHRYRAIVDGMVEVTKRDVARARAQLRSLLGGKVVLNPHPDGYLEAQLNGDYAGLIKLAVGYDQNWCGRGRGI